MTDASTPQEAREEDDAKYPALSPLSSIFSFFLPTSHMLPSSSLVLAGAIIVASSVWAVDTISTDVLDKVRANAISVSTKR